MKPKEQEILAKIKQAFDNLNKTLHEELKAITSGDYGLEDEDERGNVSVLEFNYFLPKLEVALSANNPEDDQLGYKDLLGGKGILEEVEDMKPYQESFEEDSLTKEEREFYQQIEKDFAKWFSLLWQHAGGKTVPIRAYLNPQDGLVRYDLLKDEWVKDESFK